MRDSREMTPEDTIAAIATAPGQGGVAVVRVSGPAARTIVVSLFRSAAKVPLAEARRVYVGHLLEYTGGPVIDDVLVFIMPGPRSYTGEDVVEVQCHGGSLVSRRVLEAVLAAGARAAAPGEFTKRAFLNGRIDLAQAEAVADLIAARSESGRRLAWSQLEGHLSMRIGRLRQTIIGARAHCEAAIDFPEEDVPELTEGRMAKEIGAVRAELEMLIDGFERARVCYEGARVALVGKPNVGKSSLLNALAGRERAIVTPIAGTTRDVVEATLAIGQIPVVIADTAGIRETRDPVERLGVERARNAIEDAVCTVAIFDRSEPLDRDDALVVTSLGKGLSIAVLNKCDLPAHTRVTDLTRLIGCDRVLEVSAAEGTGLSALTEALVGALVGPSELAAGEEVVIFRARHRDAARRAVDELAHAQATLAGGGPPELIASDLAAASSALGEITGEVSSEDVLDRVFAEFCIGK